MRKIICTLVLLAFCFTATSNVAFSIQDDTGPPEIHSVDQSIDQSVTVEVITINPVSSIQDDTGPPEIHSVDQSIDQSVTVEVITINPVSENPVSHYKGEAKIIYLFTDEVKTLTTPEPLYTISLRDPGWQSSYIYNKQISIQYKMHKMPARYRCT